jgi:hypothetical protein
MNDKLEEVYRGLVVCGIEKDKDCLSGSTRTSSIVLNRSIKYLKYLFLNKCVTAWIDTDAFQSKSLTRSSDPARTAHRDHFRNMILCDCNITNCTASMSSGPATSPYEC